MALRRRSNFGNDRGRIGMPAQKAYMFQVDLEFFLAHPVNQRKCYAGLMPSKMKRLRSPAIA